MQKKGFTLIELLIVVAIIAILAAIAVPNFLEAQVRAKVSRSKSDMRTLNTAIEAYRVDYNGYPVCHTFGTIIIPPGSGPVPFVCEVLSTPVSYISNAAIPSAFQAPNRISESSAAAIAAPLASIIPNDLSHPAYRSYFYQSGTSEDRISWSSATTTNLGGGNANNCILHGPGPQQLYYNLGGVLFNSSKTTANPNGASGSTFEDCLGLVYDPTNGTTSFGAIWRSMGESNGQWAHFMHAAIQTAQR